jgi:type I restriction-modification system DNA methylase subunit
MNGINTKPFMESFQQIAKHKHRYDVFCDFVTLSAISIHNAVHHNEKLEDEYLGIVKKYNQEEANQIAKLLGHVIDLLEDKPLDVLGALYMALEIGNKSNGQFFTPSAVSELMAEMTFGDKLKKLSEDYITLSEPACGAGGMVLAFVNLMVKNGYNPMYKMWVQCIDIDRLSALMCYIQLSLWNVPAQVIVGDSLSLEYREVLYTPAHYWGCWDMRLRSRNIAKPDEGQTHKTGTLEKPNPPSEPAVQFDFQF